MGMTGVVNLCGIRREIAYEWKIHDFLQLSNEANARYESPAFSFFGISWEIWIYPNGETDNGSVGCIGLYVAPQSLSVPVTVDYSFHLKTPDERAEIHEKYSNTSTFEKARMGYGCNNFIPKSKLIERESKLLPSGILTIICTLKKSDPNGVVGNDIVDEFTQTEGGTGVLKLQQNFRDLLLNRNISDVVLKVDDQEIKSHRCVLAARSSILLTMMTQEMKEKNTGVVDIHDIDPDTFFDFLNYLYTGSEEIITSENVVKLFTTADKYQVYELKKSCLDYMLTHISVDSFCDILSLSLEYDKKDLTDACYLFFVENSLAIAKTPKWLMFVKDNYVVGNELYVRQLEYNPKLTT